MTSLFVRETQTLTPSNGFAGFGLTPAAAASVGQTSPANIHCCETVPAFSPGPRISAAERTPPS
jgi:hypothetical protein